MTKHCLFGAPNLRHSRKNLHNRWLWWLRHLECLSASAPDPNSLRTTHSGQTWPGLGGLLWYGGMVVLLIRHCTLCSTQNVFEVVSTLNGWVLAHCHSGHWALGTLAVWQSGSLFSPQFPPLSASDPVGDHGHDTLLKSNVLWSTGR